MRFILNTDYSAEELAFIERNRCEVISEIRLSSVAFAEMPRRMIRYCGTYVAEIEDDGELCWAVLEKWKGQYQFLQQFPDFESMRAGL